MVTAMKNQQLNAGFTLVELMITIAIISVLAAIVVPLYTGYIREGHYVSMRSSLDRLRTDIEDYNLENGTYTNVETSAGVVSVMTDLNAGPYSYSISPSSNSYDVWGLLNTKIWVRCENRFGTCCDSETSSSSAPSGSC
jgi:prepilin-type N-terminal cleavage/methylation domain-containing protein